MRKTNSKFSPEYRIAVLDDEIGIIDSLSVILKRSGYSFTGFINTFEAVEALRKEHYDMLILDYLMEDMYGDEIVEIIRKFNQDIYILLLTGHKDLAPPLETIKTLDIQGYCEKSEKFDQLVLLIESGIKSIYQMRTIKKINEELYKTYDELKTSYMDTIELLRLTVDAKDVYTRGHSDRVAYYAGKIGKAFGMSTEEQEMLRLGGVFHDIGKIGTADDLLFKTDCLNQKEYDEIKMHTLKGARILSAVSMFKRVVPLIEHHHERIDGKGYPAGLKGGEIPFMARVLAVADAFDAMTSDRLYRSKMGLDDAINQLKSASNTQFDSEVVDKFILLLDNFEQMQNDLKDTFE